MKNVSKRSIQEIYDGMIELEKQASEMLFSEAQKIIQFCYYDEVEEYKKDNFLSLWARARLVNDTTLDVSWYRVTPRGADRESLRKEAIRKERGKHRIPLAAFGRIPSPVIRQAVIQTEEFLAPVRKIAAQHGKARRALFDACKSAADLLGESFNGRQQADDEVTCLEDEEV